MNHVDHTLTPALERDINGWQRASVIAGAVALVICMLGAFLDTGQFFRAYLVGYMFALGIALGCMAVLMIHHLTGGHWGIVIRRVLEAATRTFPLFVILFIPIVAGMGHLYPWTHSELVAKDPILQQKSIYLNIPFFLIRSAIYFLVWILLAWRLNATSAEQDRQWTLERNLKLQRLSAGGLLIYALTITFASVDWVMSLDPHWFSTIFGILFMGGQGVSGFAFLIVAAVLLARREPFSHVVRKPHLHDWGKLMFAFVMLWAYFNFSQFLIIWSANLPEEIPWYLRRMSGGWGGAGLVLVILHFVVPFALLLSRDLKRDSGRLIKVAALLLAMRVLDLYWIVAPTVHDAGHHEIPWMYFIAPIGLGGIFTWVFFSQLKKRPLLPVGDPTLEEAIAHVGH
jgi:hypothetical protein